MKKPKRSLAISTLIFTTLFFGTMISAQIPTNGLIGAYLNNGNANDGSGNNYNGVVSNAILTQGICGQDSSGYSYNGTNAYIDFPTTTGVTFPQNKMSLSIWVKIPSAPIIPGGIEMAIVEKMNQNLGIDISGNAAQGFELAFSPGNVYFRMKSGSSSGWAWITFPTDSFNYTVYNHICIVVNAIDVKAYLNDKVIDSVSIPIGTTIGDNTLSMLLGQSRWMSLGQSMLYFNGDADNLRIYNRDLSAQEVDILFHECAACSFTDTTHVTVYDSIHVTVFDTTTITVYDTLTTYLSVTDTLIINAQLTGVNPPNNINTLKLYPNPTSNYLLVDCGNISQMSGYSFKITNTLGQIMFQTTVTQQVYNLDLSTWSENGTYFFELKDSQQNVIEVKKIVLQ